MKVKIYNKNKFYIDKVYSKDKALEKIVCYCKKNKIDLFKNTLYSKKQLSEIKLLFKKESYTLSIIEEILNLTDITFIPCFG